MGAYFFFFFVEGDRRVEASSQLLPAAKGKLLLSGPQGEGALVSGPSTGVGGTGMPSGPVELSFEATLNLPRRQRGSGCDQSSL